MPNDLIPATPTTGVIIPQDLADLTDNAVSLVESLPPVTDENIGETREILLELAELAKTIDKQRTDVKAPYLAACKLIDSEAKRLSSRVDLCVSTVKTKMAGYAMDVERRRLLAAAEQSRHEAASRAEAADTGQTPRIVTSVVMPSAAPIATRTDTHVEVVDVSLIPARYMKPDVVQILADLRGGSVVPGCKLVTTRAVISR